LSIEAGKTYGRPALRKLNVQQLRAIVSKHAKEFLGLIFPDEIGNSAISPEARPKPRKLYNPPGLRKLSPEQAKLLLIGHVSRGDEGAKEVLELLFPESDGSIKERA
jgi:hypothetical protein